MKKTTFIRSGIIKVSLLLPLILLSFGDVIGKAFQGNITIGTLNGKSEGFKFLMKEINWNYFQKFNSPIARTDTIKNKEIFYDIDQMPKFNDGDPAIEFRKYISQNIRYPEYETEKGISGRVVVKFIVNTDGTVSDVEIAQGASPGLNREAIRLVKESPPWTPGIQKGEAVEVSFLFPITFTIAERKRRKFKLFKE